jgi:hypothetical protein
MEKNKETHKRVNEISQRIFIILYCCNKTWKQWKNYKNEEMKIEKLQMVNPSCEIV